MATARLGETLEAVSRGEAPLSRQMTALLVREFQRQERDRQRQANAVRTRLTLREWEILTLMGDGKRTTEIAGQLVISVETVRSHIKSILRKLGVHNQAAAVARFDGLRDAGGLA